MQRAKEAIIKSATFLNIMGVGVGLIMVLILTTNVIGRYIFRHPLIGTVEIEELMLVVLVFFGIAYAQLKKRHVSIPFIVDRLPVYLRNIINNVAIFISLLVFVLITWRSIILAKLYWENRVSSLYLEIPLAPFVLIITLGCIIMSLIIFLDYISTLKDLHRNTSHLLYAFVIKSLLVAVILFLLWQPVKLHLVEAKLASLMIVTLIVLLFSNTLIGSVLALVGFIGMAFLGGTKAALGLLSNIPFSTTASYSMCVIPFFLLMGEFAYQAGLSRSLYQTAYKWLGHLRGGLAMATVVACGGFAAVSGSSLATAATMGTVALPEMRRYNYAPSLAVGSVAAGGTIGILIPPSTILIIYGILTEQSIAKLFFAGFFPGILSIIYYVIVIYVLTKRRPELGPPGPKVNLREKFASLKDTWLVLVVFILIMGGLYAGIFTPTEAGAVGASVILAISLINRKMTWKGLTSSLLDTGETTSMIFVILIGTMIFGRFLAATKLPMTLASFVAHLPVPRTLILAIIIIFYFIFGCIMGTLPLVVLTVPIFYPVIQALGYDPIWFGIVIVMVSEIGLITPPVGMNVFIIKGVAKDVPLSTIFRGIFPFLIADFARLTTIIAFPQICLFLPRLLK